MPVKTKLPQEEEHRRRKKYQPASERRLEDRTFQCKTTSKSGTRYYNCKTLFCPARAQSEPLIDGTYSELILTHDHALCCQPDDDESIQMHEWCKKQAQSEYRRLDKTWDEAVEKFPKAAARTTKEAMRSNLKRWRLERFPPHPKTFKEFCEQVREERYTSILKSMHAKLEAHVIVDDDGEEYIIYYDRDFVQGVMRNTKYFFLDGTFQCRPGRMKGIALIFNVMGVKLGRAAVMFEVLMSRRTQKAYEAVFKHIKGVCEFSELKDTMCDFEQPMRAAFSVYWPEVSVVGCNVHFDRAIYQKLKELKVDMNKEDVKKYINWILALAFLPSDLIQETYDDIKEGMPFPIRCILEKFLKYFERFWLGIVKPDGFSIFGLFQRSNNISEQLNNKYLQYMGRGPTSCEFSLCPENATQTDTRVYLRPPSDAIKVPAKYPSSGRSTYTTASMPVAQSDMNLSRDLLQGQMEYGGIGPPFLTQQFPSPSFLDQDTSRGHNAPYPETGHWNPPVLPRFYP
ncbi:hypothetical protein QAD02_008033 [Eretmocerus hayati]|uniref:Uncharacterized protein n=1 Tax=Eretmocerus hayati TaxID=131215 RepID=A0ACC2N6Q1_9HYME|nr:hypothetical protein QAD02_008033 [Eretmocerus hayati]